MKKSRCQSQLAQLLSLQGKLKHVEQLTNYIFRIAKKKQQHTVIVTPQ